MGHVIKPHLAMGLLENPAGQLGGVPVIVADCGYGRSVGFRLAPEERGWSYVVAVDPKPVGGRPSGRRRTPSGAGSARAARLP